jgi:thioredoxin-related protein
MQRFLLFFLMAWTSQAAWGQGLEWFTDVQLAQEKAKRENKLVLLDFTGSDWCGWCIKLKHEVFDLPEFAGYAQAKLVLVEVDFPHHKAMAQMQKQANAQLAKAHHVTGYPTILVLSPEGQRLGRLGYVPGGPSAFIAKLEAIGKSSKHNVPPPRARDPEPPRKPVTFVPPPPAVPIHYGSLALKAVSGTKERRMVLINNASMLTGETATVRTEDRDVVVYCKEIREDSVLITCDGKEMELRIGQR